MSDDLQRQQFFEAARRSAEEDYKKNSKDAQALTRWGGALLELANFKPGEEASDMVEHAVSKFQKALTIEPAKHDALWCLGNAFTSQGFLSPQKDGAMQLFEDAKKCFQKALEQQPENEVYMKGVEMTGRAPELYDEIQKQIHQQAQAHAAMAAPPTTFWWDVLGWVTVAAFVFGVTTLISMNNPAAGPPAKK